MLIWQNFSQFLESLKKQTIISLNSRQIRTINNEMKRFFLMKDTEKSFQYYLDREKLLNAFETFDQETY